MSYNAIVDETLEARKRARFGVSGSVIASFSGISSSLLDLSDGGLGIEHEDPLTIGARGTIRLEVPDDASSITFTGHVRWSRLSRSPGEGSRHTYRSGIQVEDPTAVAGFFSHIIRERGTLDERSLETKERVAQDKTNRSAAALALVHPHSGQTITGEQVLLIRQTRRYLATTPQAARTWYERAKQSLLREGFITDESAIPYRSDVVAIWEYLEGAIDLDGIGAVLES